jgi:6,7-dimethyl-8-ribityllumazine synthase
MGKTYEGNLEAKDLRFALIVSRFNDFITSHLQEGALDALLRHGGDRDKIDIVRVPGSFEIPSAARRLAKSGRYDAIICLGAVIRGATPHFEYIASEVAKGIAQTSLESGVPTIFGIITADTIEQAIERAGTKSGNKGWDAALAAMEMANLFKALPV